MRPRVVRWVMLFTGCLVCASCTSYEPKPLIPAEIVASVDASRHMPYGAGENANGPAFTLALAAQWMRDNGPLVKEAVAAYETALARAKVETPFPNPALNAGARWGFGSDVEAVNRLAPFGSIGFSIPLGGRLTRQDELNEAVAEVARVEGLARHRELYLKLRMRFSELVIARARERLHENISEAARRTVGVARRLVEAGSATAVDVSIFELELARNLAERVHSEQATAATEAQLSELVGVHADLFSNISESPLPVLPENPPTLVELREILVVHHPRLGRLRATYEAAERSLRLEIAKQYPDFSFGPSYDAETGERKTVLGLTLGIELPLFDQNQQAIGEATKRREEVRVQYTSEANRALAELEGAYRSVQLSRRRHLVLREQVLPRAEASVLIARESLSAGSGNALSLLEADRSQREIQVEVLDAELEARQAWAALEQSVGYPLMTFPSEIPESAVSPPAGLRLQNDEEAIRVENSK